MSETPSSSGRLSPFLIAVLTAAAAGLALVAVFAAPFWLGSIISGAQAVAAVARSLFGDTVPALLLVLATSMLLVGLFANVWVRSRREGFTIFAEDWSARGFRKLCVHFVPAIALHLFALSMLPGAEALKVFLTEAGGCPPWLVSRTVEMIYVLLIAPLVVSVVAGVISLLGSLLVADGL